MAGAAAIPTAAAACGRSKPQVYEAIEQLQTAGVLVPLSASRRNRSWEADGLLDLQDSVTHYVGLLESHGPHLGYPYSSRVARSKHPHLRELRVPHEGRPYRVLYAFDPRRVAVLLIGGDKTGSNRWYEEFVPRADRLYDEHLALLGMEGPPNG